jgi:CheY-like chemotaxis protein
LEEVLRVEHLRVQREVDRVVDDFLKRWGADIFADEEARRRCGSEKPLVLVVDHDTNVLDFHKHFLDKEGYAVSLARSGRVMLAKIRVLKPRLIVTGLNVLHFYPPAYAWMLANLESPNWIPMLFVTAASPRRIPQEIPRSSRARVLGKPTIVEQLLKHARELA